MTITMNIKEQYYTLFEQFVQSLPKDSVQITKSLDDEILKRVNSYKEGNLYTTPLHDGLSEIREELVSQISQ